MARTWLRKVYDRDGGTCAICKQPVDWNLNGTYEDGAPQIDHFIPRDHGGQRDRGSRVGDVHGVDAGFRLQQFESHMKGSAEAAR